MRLSLRLGTCLFFVLGGVSCGGSKSGPPAGGAPAMAVVGTSGGAVASTDGQLELAVPAGAVTGNVTITVAPAEAPGAGAVSTVYEIGPTGTQFAMPVTLTLHYAPASLGGMPESALRVATFAGGAWQLLPGAVVDTQAKTVSGVTTHLSPYAIVAEMNGKTCATIQAAPRCSGGTSAGGGGSTTCMAPTCAEASSVCAGYPGATMDSCMDGTSGYTATCCFPQGGPICFAVGGAAACAGSTGGGTTCQAPPTCAGATDACAGYPGATLQNCTDGPTGYTGACCFAPQAPVCVSTGAARACSGSTGGGTTCQPAPRCADSNPCAGYAGATVQSCTDGTDGYQATCCFALGTLPQSAGTGTSGGSGGVDAGAGGGTRDGDVPQSDAGAPACNPGAACQPGFACGGGSSSGTCMQCTCGLDGTLACAPCADKDGGVPPSDAGAPACNAGAACQPGFACGGGSSSGNCMQCTCGQDGTLACAPCADKDGGVPPSDAGAPACNPGAACQPGFACNGGASGSCMQCTCGQDGTLACLPCQDKDGGTPPPPVDGGGPPPPPDGGGGGGGKTCQMSSMPSDGSTPCRVMEVCPDGTDYMVRCDPATSSCTCMAKGIPTGEMPSVACGTVFDGLAALTACGFPAGTL